MLQLCESLGLRLYDSNDITREAVFHGEAQGVKYRIDLPYDAIPRDVQVLIFAAGQEAVRSSVRRTIELFAVQLKLSL
jgi:hypothetical protein